MLLKISNERNILYVSLFLAKNLTTCPTDPKDSFSVPASLTRPKINLGRLLLCLKSVSIDDLSLQSRSRARVLNMQMSFLRVSKSKAGRFLRILYIERIMFAFLASSCLVTFFLGYSPTSLVSWTTSLYKRSKYLLNDSLRFLLLGS